MTIVVSCCTERAPPSEDLGYLLVKLLCKVIEVWLNAFHPELLVFVSYCS